MRWTPTPRNRRLTPAPGGKKGPVPQRPAGPDVARAVGRDGLDHHPPGAVAGWDRYSAPSAARTPEGGWVGSFEEPGGAYSAAASSKREAYRLARREWVRRLLG